MAKKQKKETEAEGIVSIQINAPKFETAVFEIEGTTPYVQHKFSSKGKKMMLDKMAKGSQAKKGQAKEARVIENDYNEATYFDRDGWCGIPVTQIKNSLVRACTLVGFAMTQARISFTVLADGYDAEEMAPLIKFTEGERKMFTMPARVGMGTTDIRVRPMWETGWKAKVRITYDADSFSAEDISNLLMRAGLQCGIGEGRPSSPKSSGLGWGLFKIL